MQNSKGDHTGAVAAAPRQRQRHTQKRALVVRGGNKRAATRGLDAGTREVLAAALDLAGGLGLFFPRLCDAEKSQLQEREEWWQALGDVGALNQ